MSNVSTMTSCFSLKYVDYYDLFCFTSAVHGVCTTVFLSVIFLTEQLKTDDIGYLFKDADTPVIELREQEPNENSVTVTTEEETLLVGEKQG